MTHHERPPATAADGLVDQMLAFFRGGPMPEPSGGASVPPDGTLTWAPGAATAEPQDFTLTGAADETDPDTSVGPYRLVSRLGGGGMGEVFLARHRELPLTGALKRIKPEFADEPGMRERFKVEAAAAAGLTHPNIVKLLSYDESAGQPYMVMELAPGGTLAKRLAGNPLPPREAAALVRQLASAMAYAHAKGVIHRDLKPANVLLDADGTPKVADFGLARVRDGAGLTRTGAVMGTPPYMAPEQAAGRDRDVGVQTDVYALGAILYEALTGVPPFAADTKDELLRQVQETEPARPSSRAAGLPAELEAVCLCCLAKEPAGRYANAADLAADLDHFLAGDPVAPYPLAWWRRAGRAVRKRWRPIAATAGVAAACALTALGVAAWLTPQVPVGDSAVVRAELEAELRAGRPVTLVGESGWPKWFRWHAGVPGTRRMFLAPDGSFAAESDDDHAPTLLEFLPDTISGRYRVSLKLRHDWSKPSAQVGVYVGHESVAAHGRDFHAFTAVRFNGVIGHPGAFVIPAGQPDRRNELVAPNTSVVNLAASYLTPGTAPPPREYDFCGVRVATVEGRSTRSDYWYDIKLTVAPGGVTAEFDGDRQTLAANDVRKKAPDALAVLSARYPGDAGVQSLSPAPAGRGGVGLYIYRGGVAVRDLTVTPEPD